jgi:hypothetical protein
MTRKSNLKPPKLSRIRPLTELRCLPDDAIINITEASLLIGKHPETIRRWRKLNGGPRYLKHPVYSNHVEYLIGDVRDWIMTRTVSSVGDQPRLWTLLVSTAQNNSLNNL